MRCFSAKFSAADMAFANWALSFLGNDAMLKSIFSPVGKSHLAIISLIIPCNPISLPSSGE